MSSSTRIQSYTSQGKPRMWYHRCWIKSGRHWEVFEKFRPWKTANKTCIKSTLFLTQVDKSFQLKIDFDSCFQKIVTSQVSSSARIKSYTSQGTPSMWYHRCRKRYGRHWALFENFYHEKQATKHVKNPHFFWHKVTSPSSSTLTSIHVSEKLSLPRWVQAPESIHIHPKEHPGCGIIGAEKYPVDIGRFLKNF